MHSSAIVPVTGEPGTPGGEPGVRPGVCTPGCSPSVTGSSLGGVAIYPAGRLPGGPKLPLPAVPVPVPLPVDPVSVGRIGVELPVAGDVKFLSLVVSEPVLITVIVVLSLEPSNVAVMDIEPAFASASVALTIGPLLNLAPVMTTVFSAGSSAYAPSTSHDEVPSTAIGFGEQKTPNLDEI